MFQSRFKSFQYFLLFVDVVILLTAFTAAHYLELEKLPTLIERDPYSLFVLYLVFVWIIMAAVFPIYVEQRKYPIIKTITDFIKYVSIFLSLIAISIFIARWVFVSRDFLILFIFLYTFFGAGFRASWRWYSHKLREKGYQVKHILIVGTGEAASIIEDHLTSHREFGYNLVGFLNLNGIEGKIKQSEKLLGDSDDLPYILSSKYVDEVVIAAGSSDAGIIRQVVSYCDDVGIRSWIVPDFFALVSKGAVLDDFDGIPILKIRPEPLQSSVNRFLKRFLDLVISIGSIIFILPLFSISILVLNVFFNPGPLFFRQRRHGMNNEVFECLKFRTMVNDDQTHTFKQAQKDDPRVTSLGKFLRKTNFDEIPQVINVLMGEMSIVGPRPHPVELNEQWQEEISKYMVRHFVQPGMTGWAQVNGYRGETETKHKMMKRIQYDIWYIENWSFGLDLKIIFLTAFKMISGDRAAY